MLIIPLNLDSVLLLLHNSKLAYYGLVSAINFYRPITEAFHRLRLASIQRQLPVNWLLIVVNLNFRLHWNFCKNNLSTQIKNIEFEIENSFINIEMSPTNSQIKIILFVPLVTPIPEYNTLTVFSSTKGKHLIHQIFISHLLKNCNICFVKFCARGVVEGSSVVAEITADLKNPLANYLPEKVAEYAKKTAKFLFANLKPLTWFLAKSADYAHALSYLMESLCSDDEICIVNQMISSAIWNLYG